MSSNLLVEINQMPSENGPNISDVERIANIADPVIRNLQITQCYHELGLALAERTGGGANWCAFATWASKQAGQTIRKEDLARTLQLMLGSEAAAQQALQELLDAARRLGVRLKVEELMEVLWKAYDPEAAFERSSEAVAGGNLKVFAEIGRGFARFDATFLDDPAYDTEKIAGFCEELIPGEPPDGQRYLRQAFEHYYRALFEVVEKSRIELLLLANLEIGYHEQTRLQPEINEALAAPVVPPETFARNLLKALHPGWGWLNEAIWGAMRLFGRLTRLDTAITAFLEILKREAQYITTETMMTITLPPHQRLRLGEDLKAKFPAILQQIANPELRALLSQIDPTPDSTVDSGADLWGDLPDRLHFIVDMFRCYQTTEELYEPPFLPGQTAALKDGHLPVGEL
jgi:hypothetical protein